MFFQLVLIMMALFSLILGDITMGMLDIIIIVLLLLWLGGFSLHIAGGLIHILIVIAIVLFVIRLLGIGRNKL